MKIHRILFSIFLLTLTLETTTAQTLFWSEPGAILKSRDLNTGIEKTIFQTDVIHPSNHIDYISLNTISQKIYFQLHTLNPQKDLLMVVDYSGENLTELTNLFNPTSLVYHHGENKIFYSLSNGTASEIGIRSFDVDNGSDDLIYNCQPCLDLKLDEGSGKIYFRSTKVASINLDGSGLTELSFLPDPPIFIPSAITGYDIHAARDEIYWAEGIPLIFPVKMSKANINGLDTMTLFEPMSMNSDSLYIIEPPFVDEENAKVYYFWGEAAIGEDYTMTFRRANLDGTDVAIFAGFVKDAWTIDPSVGAALPDFSVEHYSIYQSEPLREFDTKATFTPSIWVCTDGSNTSKIRIAPLDNPAFNLESLRLRVVEDPNNLNPDFFGTFDQGEIKNAYKEFEYTHPVHFDGVADLFNLSYTIEIIDQTNDQQMASFGIKFLRPPVLMVHGLWGKPSSFANVYDGLKDSPSYNEHLLFLGDYEPTNDRNFEVNKNEVKEMIEKDLIPQVLAKKVAAGKVDIVAHSMGGLLTRMYLQSEGDKHKIHKLIYINVPHSGAHMANVMYDQNFEPNNIDACNAIAVFAGSCYEGAVADLRLDNNAIDNLNSINEPPVPSHVIKSICAPDDYGFALKTLKRYAEFTDNQIRSAFNNEDNDGIVSLNSQGGGNLNDNATTIINSVDHLKIASDEETYSNVYNLLLKNPSSNSFVNQIAPINQDYIGLNNPVATSKSSIIVNEPLNGSNLIEGETFAVNFSGASDIEKVQIGFENDQTGGYEVQEVFSNNGEVLFNINPEPLGERNLMVFGLDASDNIMASSLIKIFVDTQKNPDSLYLAGRRIFDLDETAKMILHADFGSFEANIEELEGINFTFEEGNFEQVSGNEIKAIKIGNDVLRASFQGVLSNPIEVLVQNSMVTEENTISPNLGTRTTRIDKIFPNPGQDNFVIAFSSEKIQRIGIQVLNVNGGEVFSSDLKAVSGENVTPINLPATLPKGIYFLSLQSESEIQTAKFVKN